MKYFLETGYSSLNKKGEELCGDNVEEKRDDDSVTLVLADGLGSGVKANILSTLTSKILCTLISNKVDIDECIDTIIQTLPVCKVRNVAYSTFSALYVNTDGEGYLFEFDNPQAILMHNGEAVDMPREPRIIQGKTVYVSKLQLGDTDAVLVMSDGVIHAGIGELFNFGWVRSDVKDYLDRNYFPGITARDLACLLANVCNDLYDGKPGDDTTIACLRVRKPLKVRIMVGPPIDPKNDETCVLRFLTGEGKKVVCGGTSSQLVARYLHQPVQTSLDFSDPDVPPMGYIKGIDLTTEGVLTLRKLLTLSDKYLSPHDLSPKRQKKTDGASQLCNLLFEEASDITFFVGQNINVAHQGLPIDTTMKLKLVENIASNLRKAGKHVEINYD